MELATSILPSMVSSKSFKYCWGYFAISQTWLVGLVMRRTIRYTSILSLSCYQKPWP